MLHVSRLFVSTFFVGVALNACGSEEADPRELGVASERLVVLADNTQISEAVFKERTRAIEDEIRRSRAHLDIVETKKTRDGDLVDWVRPESQLPGIEPPVQLPPPLWEIHGVPREKVVTAEAAPIAAAMARAVEDRPAGTVPLFRPDAAHIALRAKSYAEYTETVVKPVNECPLPGQCRYYGRAHQSGSFWGTYGLINVWKPLTEEVPMHPMSLMQFAFEANGSDGKQETIEMGWMVCPDIFVDAWTHMFLFMTRDGYGPESCYNGACEGMAFQSWWQASQTKFPGQRISPTSTIDGSQYEIAVAVYPTTGWYLIWYIDEWIGAVRGEFFEASGLLHGGTRVGWYGEVNDPDDGVASKSDMGSGRFANAGFKRAAYMQQLQTYTRNADQSIGPTVRFQPPAAGIVATDSACYTISWVNDPNNSTLWLGGPGHNGTTCRFD